MLHGSIQTLFILVGTIAMFTLSEAATARPSPSLTTAPSRFYDPPIDFGEATPFVALAFNTMTSSGSSGTIMDGNVGIYPGDSFNGFPPAIVHGTTNAGNVIAQGAMRDMNAAYGVAIAKPVTSILTSIDLGGLVLIPGVYNFASSAALNGLLTLDARGDPDAVWTFQVYSYLVVGAGSSIKFKDDVGNTDHIYWQVGSYVTIESQVPMWGNIMAFYAVTLNNGAMVVGRVASLHAAITLDVNLVSLASKTPGFFPTAQPTFRPTGQNSPLLTFNSSVTIGAVTQPTISPNGHHAVTNATATCMGISETAVSYMSDHAPTRRRLLNLRDATRQSQQKRLDLGLLATYTLLTITNTSLTLSSTNYDNVETMYDTMTTMLEDAVQSGKFSRILQRNALLFDAPELIYAEGTGVTVGGPVTVEGYPDKDDEGLSDGAIAGIVIGCVVFVALCIALVYFFFFHASSGASAVAQKDVVSTVEV